MSRTNKKPFTRKTSRGPRERQRSCRNHGPCGWCLGNRTIAAARTKALVKEALREIQNENRYERVELIAPGQYRVLAADKPNGPWRELARTREEAPHRGNWSTGPDYYTHRGSLKYCGACGGGDPVHAIGCPRDPDPDGR